MQLSAGEFVFYKSMNGDLSIYKIQGRSNTTGKDEYDLIQVNSNGYITKNSKNFKTTLKNKSGEIRLFRIWLQPGDKVRMNNVLSGSVHGVVEKYNIHQAINNKDYTNMIEVISSDNKQHLYTFEQAEKQLEIL